MAKPTRSPLLGYNHNVKYGGQIFHVQTEDSGPGNPHIFTHLFFEGSILGSKRTEYDPAAAEDDVRGMMQSQHKAILKELKQKIYDERIIRFFETRGQTFHSEDFFADPQQPPAPVAEHAEPAEAISDDAAMTAPVSSTEPIIEATPEPTPAPLELPSMPTVAPALLDLDALPATPGERGATPEPLPMHLTKPAVPGPGTYTFRRPSRDEVAGASSEPQRPAATPSRPGPSRPITPVVVQRQVIVGAGGPPATNTRKVPTTPVRRRPVSGGPYVVKEGSHANIGGTVRRDESTRLVVAPPDAEGPPRTAEAPRPTQPRPSQEGAPAAFVTDQSLDDVILAYLSQGDGKR